MSERRFYIDRPFARVKVVYKGLPAGELFYAWHKAVDFCYPRPSGELTAEQKNELERAIETETNRQRIIF